jgi:THO complex subunit 4
VASVRLLYDRSDRSQGTAWVSYDDDRDASQAVREFDGQNANGQAIRMTLVPNAPAPQPAPRGSLFDRIEPAPRSLFDRIDPPRREDGGRRRQRSDSPRKGSRMAPDVDRYVPGGRRGGSRSPIRRRGTPREGGRRPGAKREEGGGGGGGRGGRRARTDEEGRPLVGGRPRKTAEELDAEMNDYWGSTNNGGGDAAPAAGNGDAAPANGAANGGAGDIDMDI